MNVTTHTGKINGRVDGKETGILTQISLRSTPDFLIPSPTSSWLAYSSAVSSSRQPDLSAATTAPTQRSPSIVAVPRPTCGISPPPCGVNSNLGPRPTTCERDPSAHTRRQRFERSSFGCVLSLAKDNTCLVKSRQLSTSNFFNSRRRKTHRKFSSTVRTVQESWCSAVQAQLTLVKRRGPSSLCKTIRLFCSNFRYTCPEFIIIYIHHYICMLLLYHYYL
eukprot:COSAG06_NODE_8714_length_2090_cov_1.725264_3_plen_221_part_00